MAELDIKYYSRRGHVLQLDGVYRYYETLYNDSNEPIPTSFLSRKYTFKEKLSVILIGIYEFHTLEYGKGTVIVPIEFTKMPISELSQEIDKCVICLPLHKPADDVFYILVPYCIKIKK